MNSLLSGQMPGSAAARHQFSFYLAPVGNVVPHRTVGLRQIYNVIRGDYYRKATEELRRLRQKVEAGGGATPNNVQRFKARHFDYVTFSGVFSRRREDGLLAHSGLVCLDFDHIDQWQGGGELQGFYGLRYALMHDAAIDTALLFRSPSGDGLKWVVPVDLAEGPHAEWFDALSHYVARTYNVEADRSGRDISRCCYLPWDPDCSPDPDSVEKGLATGL